MGRHLETGENSFNHLRRVATGNNERDGLYHPIKHRVRGVSYDAIGTSSRESREQSVWPLCKSYKFQMSLASLRRTAKLE
jgi:hypothetical protein